MQKYVGIIITCIHNILSYYFYKCLFMELLVTLYTTMQYTILKGIN